MDRIFAVVSCKSKRVRPQEGQEIYSVFEISFSLPAEWKAYYGTGDCFLSQIGPGSRGTAIYVSDR
jgi:hypothetical protein